MDKSLIQGDLPNAKGFSLSKAIVTWNGLNSLNHER